MKKLVLVAVFVASLFCATSAWSRNVSTSITINAQVERFAEWADPEPVIFTADWSAPLNKLHQKRIVSKPLTIYANTDAVITAEPGLNHGVLTQGNQTLDTAYQITGAVRAPDYAFKPAGHGSGEFFNSHNTYTVAHVPGTGSYIINLAVQMSSPKSSAPDDGLYTCGVILTASW